MFTAQALSELITPLLKSRDTILNNVETLSKVVAPLLQVNDFLLQIIMELSRHPDAQGGEPPQRPAPSSPASRQARLPPATHP